jgi:RimJ/RimL family protein N-acetyltransferase
VADPMGSGGPTGREGMGASGTLLFVMSSSMRLRPLTRPDLSVVEPWFEDNDTSRYLGGRAWPGRMLDLTERAVGTEFRGATQIVSFMFLAAHRGRPVGYIDCGVFDRWTEYAGEDDDGPIIRDSIEVTTGSIAFVIDVAVRGQGLGRSMIRALVARPELSEVRLFEAGVDPDNLASIRCLLGADFQPHNIEPDFEGMLYFMLLR